MGNVRMIPISNNILSGDRCGLSHDAAGLYIILSNYLNVPDYEFPKHGFKNRICNGLPQYDNGNILRDNSGKVVLKRPARDCRNKLEHAWGELYSSGLLKRHSVPQGHNCFRHEYQLSYLPNLKSRAVIYFTTREYLNHYKSPSENYSVPSEDYTFISSIVADDTQLTMIAKLLWGHIRRLINISSFTGKVLTKSQIQQEFGVGNGYFRAAWYSLRKTGYLHLVPVRGRGIQYFEFVLTDVPEHNNVSNITYTNPKVDNRRNVKQTVIAGAGVIDTMPANALKMTRKDVLQRVRDNVEYNEVMAFSGQGTARLKRYIDEYIQLIVDTVCSKKKSYRINGEDIPIRQIRKRYLSLTHSDLKSVIDRLENPDIQISNPRSYKITALYNAAVEIGEIQEIEIG